MKRLISLLIFLGGLVWSSSGIRMARDVCTGVGYQYNNICCLNCPAGTYVKGVCSKTFERSICEQCDFDYYTEHDNGLFKCLECTKCHPDQELVEHCSSTRNTLCQCKAGSFCLPEQPCEVCKTCRKYVYTMLCPECVCMWVNGKDVNVTRRHNFKKFSTLTTHSFRIRQLVKKADVGSHIYRCKDDEEIAKSCTPHSNTICQKKGSVSSTTSTVKVISILAFLAIVMVIIGLFWYWRKSAGVVSKWVRGRWKMCIENGSDLVEPKHSDNNMDLEKGTQNQPFLILTQTVGEETVDDEEDKGLGPSLPNTTTSSQASLSVCAPQSEYCHSHSLLQQLNTLENEKMRMLVPLNGDDSLRKCFDMFGDIDVMFHNRFFRILGLSDNAIRTAEGSYSSPEDRVYELLKVWMEKEGMKADFNSLIQALLRLNQRLSAESIVTKAIDNCHFRYEED